MSHPIVYRATPGLKDPDFDAYEIDEERGLERLLGYVRLPLDNEPERDVEVFVIHDKEDSESWPHIDLPRSTLPSDAVMTLHMQLTLNVYPRPLEHRWESVTRYDPASVGWTWKDEGERL